ncbi:Retrovirus-related Pol polyprotein from transposon RE2, partial [Bienertia sinuspersici]
MWKSLEQRFQISNGARKYQVTKMIYEMKQNGKSVNDYYTEMKILWEELENLSFCPPITEINPEVAAYLNAKHQQDEEQKLFQFLNGLDDINGAIRSHLLMYPTLPTADEACYAIQQEESQRESLKPVKEEQESLAMHGKAATPTCTACGKIGHIKEKCWTIVGYPPGYGSGEGRGRGRDNRGGRGARGNRARGRMNRGGGRMVGNVQCVKGETSQSTKDTSTSHGLPNINAEQLEQLGRVKLSSSLNLENVMYVPSFKHNLISIQKLVKDSRCEVKFTEKFCIVKEIDGGSVKAIGRAEKGLYILLDDTANTTAGGVVKDLLESEKVDTHVKANAATGLDVPATIKVEGKMSTEMLWHQRLGHAPIQGIKRIEELKNKVKEGDEQCLVVPKEDDYETIECEEEMTEQVESASESDENEQDTQEIMSPTPERSIRHSVRTHRTPAWMGDYYVGCAIDRSQPRKIDR